jgi:ABC-2 type transport system permease protein
MSTGEEAPVDGAERRRGRSSTWGAFAAIAVALSKGFLRDRATVFFAIVFPLMFLVIFGGLLADGGSSRIEMIRVGEVPVLDQLPLGAAQAYEETFEVRVSSDRSDAIAEVRSGEADVAVEMVGDTLVAHYTRTDPASAAMTAGTLRALVDGANVAASGEPPRYEFAPRSVEDESLNAIQYFTPGLLGWAVAMSAAIGAAATLQGWRQTKLLRRLQLSPAPTWTVVGARVVVTLGVALVQLAIFVGVGAAAFGLRLTGDWWACIPLLMVGTLSFMALGLLSGAVARTAEGAANLANFLVLPMALLSGTFFPLEEAPGWLRTVTLALPLRHLNEGMLDVMVRGEPAWAVLAPMAVLGGFAVVMTLVAVRIFRWDD